MINATGPAQSLSSMYRFRLAPTYAEHITLNRIVLVSRTSRENGIDDDLKLGNAMPLPVQSDSAPMRRTLARLEQFAASNETVVLLGEVGSGKTELARWIHVHSSRTSGRFHQTNLAALDDGLAGSDLFGYVPGAFTDAKAPREGAFAAARDGTLLLDELGKASLQVQRKLLDVVERGVYTPLGTCREVKSTARLVFAASESLDSLVEQGTMLPDLLSRLGLFQVRIPPLRERPEDIPALVETMIRRHSAKFDSPGTELLRPTPALLHALMAYDWPCNVRELDALVRRLISDASFGARRSRLLDVDLLTEDLRKFNIPSERTSGPSPANLANAIELCNGNKKSAAKMLGIGRTSLYRLLAGQDRSQNQDRAAS